MEKKAKENLIHQHDIFKSIKDSYVVEASLANFFNAIYKIISTLGVVKQAYLLKYFQNDYPSLQAAQSFFVLKEELNRTKR